MDDSNLSIGFSALMILGGLTAAILLIAVVRWMSAPAGEHPLMICANCGNYGQSKTDRPGSPIIAIVLLMFFVIPGVFYILWRQMGTKKVCPNCDAAQLVPIASPRGIELQNRFHFPPNQN